jgi:phage shock protein C
MKKKLYRSNNDKFLAGVCGGIAEYFNLDTTIIRLIALLIILINAGAALIIYIVCAIIVPVNPFFEDKSEYEDKKEVGSHKSRVVLGVILVFVGLYFIFKRYFYWFNFGSLWPVLLIIIGIIILFNGKKSDEN